MGWETKKLGEVCQFQGGSQPPKSVFISEPKDGYVRLLQIRDFKSDTKAVYIPNSKKNRICKAENIMIGRYGASVGKILKGKSGAYNVALMKSTPNPKLLNNEYFFYYLTSNIFQDPLSKVSERSAQAGFSKDDINGFLVPLPPLETQARIVSILDSAFADIERAHANAEKNLKNARELFDSSLKGIFQSRGKNWERVTLLDLLKRNWITSHLDGNHGGDYPRKDEFIETGIPYISAKCISNSQVDMTKSKYLSEEKASGLRKGIAKNGDVLFAHNATVGPVAILKTDREKIILGTSLTYYRCNENYILPEYLAQYMISYEFTSQYTSIMRQSTRNQVPITKQREFTHVIPPINEQKQVAKELVGLSEQLQQLEIVYQKKLSSLDELKQSLLQKAFSGELTKEDEGIAA